MTIYLFGEIDPQSARTVREAVAATSEPVNIWLCSNGGDVASAYAIYDAIIGQNVTIIATGECSSGGLIVLLGGARRYATPHTRFMSHAPSLVGDKVTPADSAENDRLKAMIAATFAERLLTSRTCLLSSEPMYFSVDEARQFGFIHDVWTEAV